MGGSSVHTHQHIFAPGWPSFASADAWLKCDYDTAKQAELCHKVAGALGFDLEHGRLDVSVHPLTGGKRAMVWWL